jgi:hypothetical protein
MVGPNDVSVDGSVRGGWDVPTEAVVVGTSYS